MMDKHQRYRRKCMAEGRCPHCGKPCAPYAECEERRTYKRISVALRRMHSVGLVKRVKRGVYKGTPKEQFAVFVTKVSGRKGDRRFLPKLGAKPTNPEELIMELAVSLARKNPDRTITIRQVEEAFGKERLRISKLAKKHG